MIRSLILTILITRQPRFQKNPYDSSVNPSAQRAMLLAMAMSSMSSECRTLVLSKDSSFIAINAVTSETLTCNVENDESKCV